MSASLINEIGSLILDGRIDGIVGNTIAQNCFGNNFATTIGRGTDFNIDWIQFLSKIKGPKIDFPDISSVLKLLAKPLPSPLKEPDQEQTRTGFFEHTVGDTFSLQSHGTMYDFTRGVEKTEFAIDPTYNTPGFNEGEELQGPIEFIIGFNLCTCVALQVMTIYSSILSENDQESNAAENSAEIITILELIIYGIVPVFNQYFARLIQTMEVAYYLAYKTQGEAQIAEAKAEQLIQTVSGNVKLSQELKDQMGLTQGVLTNMTTAFSDNSYNWQTLQECLKKYNEDYDIWKSSKAVFKGPKPQIAQYLQSIKQLAINPLG